MKLQDSTSLALVDVFLWCSVFVMGFLISRHQLIRLQLIITDSFSNDELFNLIQVGFSTFAGSLFPTHILSVDVKNYTRMVTLILFLIELHMFNLLVIFI